MINSENLKNLLLLFLKILWAMNIIISNLKPHIG